MEQAEGGEIAGRGRKGRGVMGEQGKKLSELVGVIKNGKGMGREGRRREKYR